METEQGSLVSVEYCPICTFPFEYCKYGSKKNAEACLAWIKKNRKDILEKYYPDLVKHKPSDKDESAPKAKHGTGVRSGDRGKLDDDGQVREENEDNSDLENEGSEGEEGATKHHEGEEEEDEKVGGDGEEEEEEEEEDEEEEDKERAFPKFPAGEFGLSRTRPRVPPLIAIRIAARSKTSKVTQIDGFQDFSGMDKTICTDLKKRCAAGAGMAKQTTGHTLIEIQGEKVEEAREVLVKKYGVDPGQITVLSDGKKAGRKRKVVQRTVFPRPGQLKLQAQEQQREQRERERGGQERQGGPSGLGAFRQNSNSGGSGGRGGRGGRGGASGGRGGRGGYGGSNGQSGSDGSGGSGGRGGMGGRGGRGGYNSGGRGRGGDGGGPRFVRPQGNNE